MKISIFGALGQQNLGDELILKNIITQIEAGKIFPLKRDEKVFFRAFTYDRKNPFLEQKNISYQEYFPHHIRNPLYIFKNIRNFFSFFSTLLWSDFVIIGGGGLFYDTEIQVSKHNLKLWKWRTSMIKKLGKKVIFYGVSIDIKQEENKVFLVDIFSGAFKIFVRDKASQDILTSLSLESKEIWDPVLYDTGDLVKKNSCIKILQSSAFEVSDLQEIDFAGKTIGLALRKGYFGEREEDTLISDLIHFLLDKGVQKIFLLPMSFHPTDYEANDRYFLDKFVGDKVELGGETMQDIYNIFTNKEIDICFAMRLHSIILSHVYEIPYVALSYSKKTDENLKKLSV